MSSKPPPARRLTRPRADADRAGVTRYHEAVAAALTELEVAHGEDFILVAATDLEGVRLGHFVSETSRQAALANYPRTGKQRHRVAMAVLRAGNHGRTRDELAEELGLSANSVRPRVVELLEGAWIEDSGGTRRTSSGQDAEVLRASEALLAEAQRRGEAPAGMLADP